MPHREWDAPHARLVAMPTEARHGQRAEGVGGEASELDTVSPGEPVSLESNLGGNGQGDKNHESTE